MSFGYLAGRLQVAATRDIILYSRLGLGYTRWAGIKKAKCSRLNMRMFVRIPLDMTPEHDEQATKKATWSPCNVLNVEITLCVQRRTVDTNEAGVPEG